MRLLGYKPARDAKVSLISSREELMRLFLLQVGTDAPSLTRETRTAPASPGAVRARSGRGTYRQTGQCECRASVLRYKA